MYAVVNCGESKTRAAKLFGFSKTSITKYVYEYGVYGERSFEYKKRGATPGSGQYLTAEQVKELIDLLLSKTPDELSSLYVMEQ